MTTVMCAETVGRLGEPDTTWIGTKNEAKKVY